MAFELERVLEETEDFLRRAIGSPSLRAAKKRRFQRKLEEFGRRARRSAFVLIGLVALLLAVSIYAGGIGFFAWLVAVPTALAFALLLMFQPTRHHKRRQAEAAPGAEAPPTSPLGNLALRAEEGLLDRCDELPGRALPAADAIVARLRELQPHLASLDPADPLAGDARRLIGQHLPRLVDSYLQLPHAARAPGAESSRRVAESLDIVAAELGNLLDACCRDSQASFDTHSRFIETRYRDGDLRGG
ncbi:MAG: hypothetical protein QOD42_3515 [Sphingomonadales bacterium]|jgi:hypothetical protein|nr:hypothetical protein [Sphingomonadales bacterium]